MPSSACSEFFRDAFKRMLSSKYPVQPMSIYLRGVSIRELKSVLEFMYQVFYIPSVLNFLVAVVQSVEQSFKGIYPISYNSPIILQIMIYPNDERIEIIRIKQLYSLI